MRHYHVKFEARQYHHIIKAKRATQDEKVEQNSIVRMGRNLPSFRC